MVPDETVAPGTVKISVVECDGSERDIQAHFNVITFSFSLYIFRFFLFLPRPRFLLSCTFSLLFCFCRDFSFFFVLLRCFLFFLHIFASFLFLLRP